MLDTLYIFLILSVFLYLLVCAIIYMIYQVYKEKKFNQKIAKVNQSFELGIYTHLKQIERAEILPQHELEQIKKYLKKPVYEAVFNQTLLAFKKEYPDTQAIAAYIKNYPEYLEQIIKKNSPNEIEQTYKVFLIGQYQYRTPESFMYLQSCLQKKSIYIRLHALEALQALGDPQYFFEALQKLSQKAIYIYPKAIIDIIDSFPGDTQQLSQLLIKDFHALSETIQICCIEHWKHAKAREVAPYLLEVLQQEQVSVEVQLSIVKYFSEVKYEPCQVKLQQLIKSENWTIKAITAKALAQYPCAATTEALLQAIKDKNWYVRNNSASALTQFEKLDQIGKKVLEQQDLYAQEAFFYGLLQNKYITYDQYLDYQVNYKFEEIHQERESA